MIDLSQRMGRVREEDVHEILRNQRRRHALEHLRTQVGVVTLRGLTEAIADTEADESPPPRNLRHSIYNSLHQTHLPKLDEMGVIEYDRNRKTIRLTENARSVDLYMEVVTPYGITWATYYQALLVLALSVLLAANLDAPVISAVPELLWISFWFAVTSVSVGYQLWSRRWFYLRQLVD